MYSSDSTSLIIICVVLLFLAAVAVALRFVARNGVKAGLGADDYIMLIALVKPRYIPMVPDREDINGQRSPKSRLRP